MSNTPRTVVHFVGGTKPGHVAKHIFVNGQEVRVAEDGASITYGPAQTTTVTLDLQASEVSFTSTPPEPRGRGGGGVAEHVAEVRGVQIADLTERNVELQAEVERLTGTLKTYTPTHLDPDPTPEEMEAAGIPHARYAREDAEAERPTSQPPMTVDLPAGMTEPSVLRLVAAEVRRGPLGFNDKPRSLPGTLDALADAMDDARYAREDAETRQDDEALAKTDAERRLDLLRQTEQVANDAVTRAERAEAEVERLTRERDEHKDNSRYWRQCYEAAEYQIDHPEDADGNALVTVRVDDAEVLLDYVPSVLSGVRYRLRRALDKREADQ